MRGSASISSIACCPRGSDVMARYGLTHAAAGCSCHGMRYCGSAGQSWMAARVRCARARRSVLWPRCFRIASSLLTGSQVCTTWPFSAALSATSAEVSFTLPEGRHGHRSTRSVTTTDSANVASTGGAPVAVRSAERVSTARVPAAIRAERRAWLLLWLAFATFCALVFAISKFGLDHVSTAEVDQSAMVTAARGQPVYTLQGSADKTLLGGRTELGVGTVVTLDRTTVASLDLQFFDESSIRMLGGAEVELTRMEVGRFINQ